MCLAIPGRILEIKEGEKLSRVARVDFGGLSREVSLACVPEAKVGDYVMVHVGFALSVVDQGEAARMMEEIRELVDAGGGSASEESPG